MKIEKGSKEWQFFMDFWDFVQKNWGCEDTDKYWEQHIKDFNEIRKKYPEEEKIGRFAKWIMNGTAGFFDCESRRKRNGN